jgi:iron complex transport system permease protein
MNPKYDINELYGKIRGKKILLLFLLTLLLLAIIFVSICLGAVPVSLQDIFNPDSRLGTLVFNVRIPRVLMAVMAGTCLAIAGTIMQGILRNPLASPYVLGIAAGASFGATLAIALGLQFVLGRYALFILAFIFSLITMFMVYGLASAHEASTETLILAGIAIGSLFNAMVSFLIFISGESIYSIIFWIMGGLWGSSWEQVYIILPVLAIGFIIALWFSWDMNALSMGDEIATNLGVKVKLSKVIILTLASILTAVTISITGTIGFIGLVAPHIARMIIGTDNRFLIPASSLIGAMMLLPSDTLSRTIINPAEIPVGIVTAMIGVPFFVYLLLKKRKGWWA